MTVPDDGLAYPGFADPVHDAQASFRAVLRALARPGALCTVATPPAPPPPLAPASAAVLLTLVDADAPVHLPPPFAGLGPWVAFHTGSTGADIGDAAFVLADEWPDLALLAAGTDEVPEASTTLILQVPALEGGPRLILRGPGIEATQTFAPLGLPADFAARWAANRRLYPRGIDVLLCAGSAVAGLPRSVTVLEAA
ncbi:MAG: phosphonate C-P lyase system protein PhnH [Rhodospirillales bacterium]|nr:phosphonate C-P lyase system protein PhnH [Rhodospirillales bacterium]